jgi:hypothetical protein
MQRYISILSLVTFLVFLMGACSSTDTREEAEDSAQEETKEKKDPATGSGANTASREDVKTPSTKPETTTVSRSGDGRTTTTSSRGGSAYLEVPPYAIPGQCFHKVHRPVTYKDVQEQVMVKPEEVKIEIIPAKYEEVAEQVLVRPATTVLETVPPKFKMVDEKVITRQAYVRKEEIPPTFETVSERVIDKEGYSEWKKDSETGLTCLVDVPPTYKDVQRQIMRTPALVREVEVPAEYTLVRKQVEEEPATTRKVELPAVFKTVYVKKEIEPEKQVKTVIPPEYKMVSRTVVDQEAKTEWEEVLCETNATSAKVRELEEALKKAGYDPGTIDGKPDNAFWDSIRNFQRDKGFPVSNDQYISMETVKSLGVSPR